MEGEILATVCPWMAMVGEIFYPEQLAGVCVCLHFIHYAFTKNPLGPDAAA